MKDKDGNKLTIKEFFDRWGKGIEGITPIQKLKTQLCGTRIMLVGLFLGIGVSLSAWDKFWWVAIVLTGAVINTGVQYIGQKQQLNQFNNLENLEETSLNELFNKYKLKDTEGEYGS